MSRKNKIIIALILIIIIIAVALLLWWWFRVRPERQPVTPAINTNTGLQIPANLPSLTATLPAEPAGLVKQADIEADMKSLAMTFAERFGSFSNDGDYINLDTLTELSTAKEILILNSLKAKYLAAKTEYFGVTTKALSAQITSYDAASGQAEMVVSTQRREAQGTTANPTVYYQDLNLRLLKIEGRWLVDSADWAG